jgi:hypothetical protein
MENWQMFTIIGANLAILFAFMGTTIGLFMHNDRKITETKKEISDRTREIIKEIRDSNLDFHGRLAMLEGKTKGK